MDELSLSTVMILYSLVFFSIWLFCNWHIRYTFVAVGYNRKGSYNRVIKKYKKNWTLSKRMFLIPLLLASKSNAFKFLFFVNWLHLLMTFVTGVAIFWELSGRTFPFPGHYTFYVLAIIILVEIAVTLETGRRCKS